MAQFLVSQPVGMQVYGPVAFANNLDVVDVRFSNWLQADRTLAVVVEMSFDGGVTWQRAGSMNPTPGARPVGRDGTTDCSFMIFGSVGVNRQIRATVTVAGSGPISTQMTIRTT